MKISKLFHWLYAILMLLPFAFFVPSVLYYAFNDNATMQSVEVRQTETIAVDFKQYSVNQEFTNTVTDTREAFSYQLQVFDGNTYKATIYAVTVSDVGLVYARFGSGYEGNVLKQKCNGQTRDVFFNETNISIVANHIYLTSNLFTAINPTVVDGFRVSNMMVFDLTQMFGSGNEPTIAEFNQMFPNSYYPYTAESELMQITYETGTTEQLIENTSIINYAWESVWDLPLFSWTKVTFVSVPFSYLTGIFGIGASNSLNYVFGYFVTISIVWLVFDLLLYVPMLAHNWIDKARIE